MSGPPPPPSISFPNDEHQSLPASLPMAALSPEQLSLVRRATPPPSHPQLRATLGAFGSGVPPKPPPPTRLGELGPALQSSAAQQQMAARLVGRPPPRPRPPQPKEEVVGEVVLTLPVPLVPPPDQHPIPTLAHLELPPHKTMRLISPPPSPPAEWTGGPEDGPNRVPFVDLTPRAEEGGTWLLFQDPSHRLPEIRLMPAEDAPHSTL